MLLRPNTVEEKLAGSAEHDLARDTDGLPCFVSKRRSRFVGVVEDDGNGCFCNARLATLVDQILWKVSRSVARQQS